MIWLRFGLHHIDGEVIEDCAVDGELTLVNHRRQDSGSRACATARQIAPRS